MRFAANQWKLLSKESPPRAKPVLYLYRVLLTGIHLMRSGVIEANLLKLNQEFALPYIDELVERKKRGGERGKLSSTDLSFHEGEYRRLVAELEKARDATNLPEKHGARPALNDLLLPIRQCFARA